MFSNDLDPERVLREYKTRLEQAEYERQTLRMIMQQQDPSGQLGPISRLLVVIANALIAAGTRLRDFACSEPCEPTPESARL